VAVLEFESDVTTAGTHGPHPLARLGKIEDHPMRHLERESHDDLALHSFFSVGRDNEGQLVTKVSNGSGPLARQYFGNPRARHIHSSLGGQRHREEQGQHCATIP
jgi:hypothetical protein